MRKISLYIATLQQTCTHEDVYIWCVNIANITHFILTHENLQEDGFALVEHFWKII